MKRVSLLVLSAFLALASCTTGTVTQVGPDGERVQTPIYRIPVTRKAEVQFRMLDAVNALRSAAGLREVRLNSRLNAAAETHSRDMSIQNRPWHFGSDGSSPLDRVRRVGYDGRLLGENISETFETELQTLNVWMERPATRSVIMDTAATEMGFAWFQEGGGKIWWTLVMGGGGGAAAVQG